MSLRRYGWMSFLLATLALCSLAHAAETTAPAATPAAAPAPPPAPTYTRNGADTCLNCHDDEVTAAIFKGPHGAHTNERTPFGHNQLQCEACHGPGGNHVRRVPSGQQRPNVVRFGHGSPTPVDQQNGMCIGCHKANVGVGWHAGEHASNNVACADCHTSHAGRDPVLVTATQSETCGTCHAITRAEAHRAFAHPIDQGKMSCTSCHDPHGGTSDAALVRKTTNDTCFTCHADKRGPFLWEHAPVAEDCTSCHAPHGSSHPGMLKQRGPMLCQNCHSQAGHPSLAPTPAQSLPGQPRATYVLGMNCMNCHSQVHGSNHPSGSKLMR